MSANSDDAFPMRGRLKGSRSPADPNTWIRLPLTIGRTVERTWVMALGVWAKSTITVKSFLYMTSILPVTPEKSATAFRIITESIESAFAAPIAAKQLY